MSEGRLITGVRGRRGEEPFECRARLVVGDDGVHSVVRTALGLAIGMKMFPVELVSALIEWPDELPPNRGRAWINPSGFRAGLPVAVFIPWPQRRGVMLLPMLHDRAERLLNGTAESFRSELAQVTPLAPVLSKRIDFPRGFSRVRRPSFGHVARYVADGAALIGDAAHPMTPAGGQGANASIADAMALAEVADAALRAGDVTAEQLAVYERRRRQANERSVNISRSIHRIFRFLGPIPRNRVARAASSARD